MYFGQNCLLNLSLAGIICFLKNDVNGVIMAKLKVTEDSELLSKHAVGVIIGPSLPPFVEGQLRCFLHLSIGELKWTGTAPSKNVKIGVKWWGQQSKPVFLEPRNQIGIREGKPKHEAKYPIRSGPKQFSAYLKDMGALSLDIFANGDPIGQVNVEDIALLCHSRPVKGFYPVISHIQKSFGNEIGVVHISLIFHSVSGSFNMTSSTIPTTDITSPVLKKDKASKLSKHESKVDTLRSSSKVEERKKKPKGVKISSAPPEKIEYSIQSVASDQTSFVVGPGRRYAVENNGNQGDHHGNNEADNEMHEDVDLSRGMPESPEDSTRMESNAISGTLAKLIERGQNLRNRMLLSTIETPQTPTRRNQGETQGNLIKDILDQVENDQSMHSFAHADSTTENVRHVDRALVDLITDDETQRIGQMLKKLERDSDGSLSEDFSDIDDPIHEESLLTELFYTAKQDEASESSVILTDESDGEHMDLRSKSSPLEDAGNKRPKMKSSAKRSKRKRREGISKEIDANEEIGNDNDSMAYLNENNSDVATEKSESGTSKSTKDEFTRRFQQIVPEGMDLDTVTVLARVQFARVIIKTLDLPKDSIEKYYNCTFFVEYDFPVASTEIGSKTSSYSELTRCASNKVEGQSILFNHRSVFPVRFDGATITNWWSRYLNFKIYVRYRAAQSPSYIGKQSMALRKVFFTETFVIHDNLAFSKELNDDNEKKDKEVFGNLQVSIELASDKEDVRKKQKYTNSVAEPRFQNGHRYKRIQVEPTQQPLIVSAIDPQKENLRPNAEKPRALPEISDEPSPEKDVILRSLLCIPEGRKITKEYVEYGSKPPNCYLVCRSFWNKVSSKSKVCWNTSDPEFNFIQTIPIVLNPALLEGAKNNFMVIEVWDKCLSADEDKLLGIVKVSLHPFYLSFKDPSIIRTMLKSQYPVIAVDGFMKISDLFHNSDRGQLRIVLALGTEHQIDNLLRIKDNPISTLADPKDLPKSHIKKNYGDIDEVDFIKKQNENLSVEGSTEHVFSISIENAKNLGASLDDELGERDCFVQYRFPEQKRASKECTLTWYKTQTALFVDNPVFGYSQKHTITSVEGAPVQSFFLNSFEHDRSSTDIAFELWQRSYYPNIRDCLFFKAMIPIAKVYAMMTMSRGRDTAFQNFKLPLTPTDANTAAHDVGDGDAELNVCIGYQQKKDVNTNLAYINSKSPCVIISVSVLRACGLKACVSNLPRNDKMRRFASNVINPFVTVSLSFLGNESLRTSSIIARSFAPTFSFHVDFPVSVIQDYIETDQYDETTTLAYHLETGYLDIQLFHKEVRSGFLPIKLDDLIEEKSEFPLGGCRVPLINLLSHYTGIKGWVPLSAPHRKHKRKNQQGPGCDADEFENRCGGLELLLRFGKESDRELVINTARGIGWSPLESLETHEDSFATDAVVLTLNAVISVDKIWLTKEIVMNFAEDSLSNFQIYCRYKFYQTAALATNSVPIEIFSSTDVMSADLSHKKGFQISASSALSWYLREEPIEFQFWLKIVSSGQKAILTHTRDKLIGSVFVDASSIARNPALNGSVSGLYPLYKFGADYLGKSSARVSVQITDYQEELKGLKLSDEYVDEIYPYASDSDDVNGEKSPCQENRFIGKRENAVSLHDRDSNVNAAMNEDDSSSIQYRILIEEASHLPEEITSQGTRSPSTYACYQITPLHKTTCTDIILQCTRPKWKAEKIEMLNLYKVPNMLMHFKVFKKTSEQDPEPDINTDELLGIATVDLSLLMTGFRCIHGWYNLLDFSGQKTGQIKVGVFPNKLLATSPSARYFRKETLADKVYSDIHWDPDVVRNLTFGDGEPSNKTNSIPLQTHSQLGMDAYTIIPETSKSILFGNLREQMAGLESLTEKLRNKLRMNNDNDMRSNDIIHQDHTDEFAKNISVSFDQCLQSFSEYGSKPENSNGVILTPKTTDLEDMKIESLSLLQPSMRENACAGINCSDNIEGQLLDTTSGAINEPLGSDSNDNERGFSACDDFGERTFDSFNDVLSNWKTHCDDNQADDLIDVDKKEKSSDDQLIKDFSIRKENRSRNSDSDKGVDHVDFNKLSKPKNCADAATLRDAERIHDYQDPSFLQEPFNLTEQNRNVFRETENEHPLSSSKQRKVVLDTDPVQDDPEIAWQDCQSGDFSHFLNEDGINDEDNNEFRSNLEVEPVNEIGSDDEVLLDSQIGFIDVVKSQTKEDAFNGSGNVPNFFMPPQILAQSMQKLRLTITQALGDASLEDGVSNSEATHVHDINGIEGKTDKRKMHFLKKEKKISLDDPPPLDSSEINRIASIFTLKLS